MDIETPPPPPPPPLLTTTIPQSYYNTGTPLNDVVPHHNRQHSSSSPTSSIIIVMIIISSAIIISATIYLLIRFISRRYNRSFRTSFSPTDVVSHNPNSHEHVISLNNNLPESSLVLSLPLFTFSSLTGKIAGGDCAVCLSKFETVDLLRLLPLCCHAFHAECIDTWLKSNLTCPLCRSNVNPSESDIMNSFCENGNGNGNGSGNRSNSFRIEIGTISQRREPSNSDRRSYSVGSYDYVLDVDGYEIPIESTHRSAVSVVSGASDRVSVDKDSVSTNAEAWGETGGSGRFNRLRDYVDRFSASLRSSGRFFTGSSRRSEGVNEFDVAHGRIGEEISELFRWLSGV